jgi:hypothetical protein
VGVKGLARGDRKWPLNERHNAHTFVMYVLLSVRATILLAGLGGRGETAA